MSINSLLFNVNQYVDFDATYTANSDGIVGINALNVSDAFLAQAVASNASIPELYLDTSPISSGGDAYYSLVESGGGYALQFSSSPGGPLATIAQSNLDGGFDSSEFFALPYVNTFAIEWVDNDTVLIGETGVVTDPLPMTFSMAGPEDGPINIALDGEIGVGFSLKFSGNSADAPPASLLETLTVEATTEIFLGVSEDGFGGYSDVYLKPDLYLNPIVSEDTLTGSVVIEYQISGDSLRFVNTGYSSSEIHTSSSYQGNGTDLTGTISFPLEASNGALTSLVSELNNYSIEDINYLQADLVWTEKGQILLEQVALDEFEVLENTDFNFNSALDSYVISPARTLTDGQTAVIELNTTTSSLPTGMVVGTTYYVVASPANVGPEEDWTTPPTGDVWSDFYLSAWDHWPAAMKVSFLKPLTSTELQQISDSGDGLSLVDSNYTSYGYNPTLVDGVFTDRYGLGSLESGFLNTYDISDFVINQSDFKFEGRQSVSESLTLSGEVTGVVALFNESDGDMDVLILNPTNSGSGIEVDMSMGLSDPSGEYQVTSNSGSILTATVSDLEAIVGSSYNDHISGDRYQNVLIGGAGSDLIEGDGSGSGVAGGDTVSGTEWLVGGRGDDVILASSDIDTVLLDLDGAILIGGAQHDTFVVRGEAMDPNSVLAQMRSGSVVEATNKYASINNFELSSDKISLGGNLGLAKDVITFNVPLTWFISATGLDATALASFNAYDRLFTQQADGLTVSERQLLDTVNDKFTVEFSPENASDTGNNFIALTGSNGLGAYALLDSWLSPDGSDLPSGSTFNAVLLNAELNSPSGVDGLSVLQMVRHNDATDIDIEVLSRVHQELVGSLSNEHMSTEGFANLVQDVWQEVSGSNYMSETVQTAIDMANGTNGFSTPQSTPTTRAGFDAFVQNINTDHLFQDTINLSFAIEATRANTVRGLTNDGILRGKRDGTTGEALDTIFTPGSGNEKIYAGKAADRFEFLKQDFNVDSDTDNGSFGRDIIIDFAARSSMDTARDLLLIEGVSLTFDMETEAWPNFWAERLTLGDNVQDSSLKVTWGGDETNPGGEALLYRQYDPTTDRYRVEDIQLGEDVMSLGETDAIRDTDGNIIGATYSTHADQSMLVGVGRSGFKEVFHVNKAELTGTVGSESELRISGIDLGQDVIELEGFSSLASFEGSGGFDDSGFLTNDPESTQFYLSKWVALEGDTQLNIYISSLTEFSADDQTALFQIS